MPWGGVRPIQISTPQFGVVSPKDEWSCLMISKFNILINPYTKNNKLLGTIEARVEIIENVIIEIIEYG